MSADQYTRFLIILALTVFGAIGYLRIDSWHRKQVLLQHCGQIWDGTYAYCDGNPEPPRNQVYMDLRKDRK